MTVLASTGADLASLLPWIIGAAVVVVVGGVLLVARGRKRADVDAPQPPRDEA